MMTVFSKKKNNEFSVPGGPETFTSIFVFRSQELKRNLSDPIYG